MAFSRDWNATYEETPGGSEAKSLGDDRIRNFKTDVRERFDVDHYMPVDGTQADHGQHRKILFREPLTSNPTVNADEGCLFPKDAGGVLELHWLDESGNEVQLTSGGALNASTLPSGTYMLFYQDTAPTGWTIQNTLNDKLVFVTKGSAAGGETGGGTHSAGTWTISGLTFSGVAGTTGAGASGEGYDERSGGPTPSVGGHTHSFTPSGSVSQGGAWRPAAYCCIICSKD